MSAKSAKTAAPTLDEAEAANATKVAVRRPPRDEQTTDLPDAEPPEKLSALAGEYIGLSIAGGLIVGLLIGALFPRSAASKLAKRSSKLAAVAGEVGVALATQALAKAGEAARESREKAVDMGEVIAERSAEARASAGRLLDDGTEKAREGGRTLARKAAELVSRVKP